MDDNRQLALWSSIRLICSNASLRAVVVAVAVGRSRLATSATIAVKLDITDVVTFSKVRYNPITATIKFNLNFPDSKRFEAYFHNDGNTPTSETVTPTILTLVTS
jgi:hypothetical protein